MALQVSGAGFGLIHGSGRSTGLRVRAAASESVTTSRGEEVKVKLGGTDVKVTKLGIGAWSWGDTGYWNDSQWDERPFKSVATTTDLLFILYIHKPESKLQAAKAAFDASIDGGITLFDTAEVYGAGIMMGAVNSETLLGEYVISVDNSSY